jgi:hypothetical protein
VFTNTIQVGDFVQFSQIFAKYFDWWAVVLFVPWKFDTPEEVCQSVSLFNQN